MDMTATTEKLEASKKLARDYIDQVFNQHNPAKAADFVTGDVVWHGGALGDITGAENLAGLPGRRRLIPPRFAVPPVLPCG